MSHRFELGKIGYERQKSIELKYKTEPIGNHRIDFLVRNEVIVKLKATDGMPKIFESQLLTYTKAMTKRVGLLINFINTHLKDGIKRMILQKNNHREHGEKNHGAH